MYTTSLIISTVHNNYVLTYTGRVQCILYNYGTCIFLVHFKNKCSLEMYFKTGFLCLLIILYLERLPGRGSRRTGFPVCTGKMPQSGLGKGT